MNKSNKTRAVSNGEMPAGIMDRESAQRAEEGHYDVFNYGLTKRERFAMAAMQGLMASDSSEWVARNAVEQADKLLLELENS